MSQVVLYNTRTRRKESFEPLEPAHARIYSCGPTVYTAQHLGNMVAYMFVDLLRRTLEDAGIQVTNVVNVTDVGHLTDDADDGDDKMELAAKNSGQRAEDIAARFTEMYMRDRRRLNCIDPEVLCKATDHIEEQIAMARVLEDKGFTYALPDGLYFDVSKFPRYAEFSRLDLAHQGEAGGARLQAVEGKRNSQDFALWKFAADGVKRQQEWDSPWGRGFPGWHLECSAMSVKYLGERFDIHTGGVDHVPVHHTNEIAQTEGALDVHPWVQVWMHNEHYHFKGEKMSKSKGNIALLDEIVDKGIEPLAYRYFFLQAHYRQQVNLTDEAMVAARTGYRRLVATAAKLREVEGAGDPDRQAPFRERFRAALRDDLNAPQGMAVAWEVARSSDLSKPDRRDLLLAFDEVLGLDLATASPTEAASESDPRIDALLAQRDAARRDKDFATADRIRDELAAENVEIVDTPEGSHWRRG